jgi:phosphatidylinositol kinase/protein kinase (PI-3  family)
MLGYLVGLGDRHGENILLDTDSGRLEDEQDDSR